MDDSQKIAQMRNLITKTVIKPSDVVTMSPELILLFQSACVALIAKLEVEVMLLSSVDVIAIAKDDIKNAYSNLRTLRGAKELQRLGLDDLSMN